MSSSIGAASAGTTIPLSWQGAQTTTAPKNVQQGTSQPADGDSSMGDESMGGESTVNVQA